MFKKLFMALLLITSMATFALAENESDNGEYKNNGDELVQKYTEEYINLEEAEKLGVRVEEVQEENVQNHKKLEKPTILQKNELREGK